MLADNYRKRYLGYRTDHGVICSWVLACDPIMFMIVWPTLIGIVLGLWIDRTVPL
jgi:hypothetical protein